MTLAQASGLAHGRDYVTLARPTELARRASRLAKMWLWAELAYACEGG